MKPRAGWFKQTGVLISLLACVCSVALLSSASAQESFGVGTVAIQGKPSYSPYAGRNFSTRPLWGDTHLHTALSLDARAAGVILTHDDAYRFAKGEEVTSSHGMPLRIGQPLDWLVITDHSDAMGAMNEVIAGNANLLTDPTVRDWHNRLKQPDQLMQTAIEIVEAFTEGNTPEILLSRPFQREIWDDVLETAEAHNEPGSFSAIIGFEWTSTPGGNNLHRNVLYRDDADVAGRVLPLTVAEGVDPLGLYQWMENYEATTGGQMLAIAHNGNLSNGIMFPAYLLQMHFRGKTP